jgi:integrase
MEIKERRSQRTRGHIDDLGDGRSWVVRVSLGTGAGGKRIYLRKVITGKVGDAKKALTSLLKVKDEGGAEPLTRENVDNWVQAWLAHHCTRQSARTRTGYRDVLERYLTPELRTRKIALLTVSDVQRWVNVLVARGPAPRTVRSAHGALRKCLSDAIRVGKLTTRNVATFVQLPKLDHREMQALTPEQTRVFLTAVRDTPYAALFTLWVHTGLRNSELAALRWEDFTGSSIRVRRAFVQVDHTRREIGPTKTGRQREIPLSAEVARVLRSHRRGQLEHKLKVGELYHDQGHIFSTETGQPISFQNISSRFFKPLLKQHGLPDIRLYDLRHTCATLLFSTGADIKVVQERLGHATPMLTLSTYTHVLPGQQLGASQRLADLLQTGTR